MRKDHKNYVIETGPGMTDMQAQDWGRELASKVKAVLQNHPNADPDNIRHTLILLKYPPLERLARSLLRGGAFANRE